MKKGNKKNQFPGREPGIPDSEIFENPEIVEIEDEEDSFYSFCGDDFSNPEEDKSHYSFK